MMSTAFEYYQSINRKVHVPKAFNFISRKENDAFWDEILPKAPQAYRLRGDLVIMERILPLQKFVRKALISQFCALDNTEIETILNHPQTSTVSPGFTSTRATVPLTTTPTTYCEIFLCTLSQWSRLASRLSRLQMR